jgi:hypothetical protein
MQLNISGLSIKSKLMLLAAISALGFAAIGFAIEYQTRVNEAAATARAASTHRLAEFQMLDESLAEARRFQRDMIIRRDLSIGRRAIEANRQARAAVQSLAAVSDTAFAGDFAEIGGLIDRYGRHLDELVALMRRIGVSENEGQQGAMRRTIRDAEGALNQLGLDKIVVSVLQLRRHEKDFQLREAKASADLHAREMGHLKELLAGSGLPEDRRKELIALASAYGEAFDALVVSIGARNAKIAELDGSAATLDPIVAKIREAEASAAASGWRSRSRFAPSSRPAS